MNYWVMQLKPNPKIPKSNTDQAISSLTSGFIGLINEKNLTTELEDFKNGMSVGDIVMIVCNDYPFALVKIMSNSIYMEEIKPDAGIYYNDFRIIKTIKYYFDYTQQMNENNRINLIGILSKLVDPNKKWYKIMNQWYQDTNG